MNQLNRSILKKCMKCNNTIFVPQVYDKHYSVYVDARMPICCECDIDIGIPTFNVPKQDQENK